MTERTKVWRRRSYQIDEDVLRLLSEFCFVQKQRPSHVIAEALKEFFRQAGRPEARRPAKGGKR